MLPDTNGETMLVQYVPRGPLGLSKQEQLKLQISARIRRNYKRQIRSILRSRGTDDLEFLLELDLKTLKSLRDALVR